MGVVKVAAGTRAAAGVVEKVAAGKTEAVVGALLTKGAAMEVVALKMMVEAMVVGALKMPADSQ